MFTLTKVFFRSLLEIEEQDGIPSLRGLFKKYPTFLHKAHNTINFKNFIQSPSKYSPWCAHTFPSASATSENTF